MRVQSNLRGSKPLNTAPFEVAKTASFATRPCQQVLASGLVFTMSKMKVEQRPGLRRTFIACSDGVLEMTSINLGAQ